ncbi:hypothetical protein G6F43_001184 [Rhizopus delemar]|nr:hypothetical protein G6F43_001184 [Rhizopus delemar]
MTNKERIFIVGGTGNIGSRAVRNLIAKDIPVTLYARNPEKVNALFSGNELVKTLQGDYNDLSPLKEGLKNHSRLFLLIGDFNKFSETKKTIATYAYEAGVKQIVDISSLNASFPWRSNFIGNAHRSAEEAMLNISNRGYLVALRPGRFMSNLVVFEVPHNDVVASSTEPDIPEGWISPNDIGDVAAVILTEDIEKHKDAVYELNGDVVTPAQRTDIFSRVVGRPFTYKKISVAERYNIFTSLGHASHDVAFAVCTSSATIDSLLPAVTDGMEILLGRKPETLEKYIFDNKDHFKQVNK